MMKSFFGLGATPGRYPAWAGFAKSWSWFDNRLRRGRGRRIRRREGRGGKIDGGEGGKVDGGKGEERVMKRPNKSTIITDSHLRLGWIKMTNFIQIFSRNSEIEKYPLYLKCQTI